MQKSRIWIRYKSKTWEQFLNKKNEKAKAILTDFTQKIKTKPIVEKDDKTWWVQIP